MFDTFAAVLSWADWYSSWITVSLILTTIAFYPYVRNLWKAEDGLSPTISGWVSWSLSDATILAAQLWTGFTTGSYDKVGWQNAIYVAGPVLVIALSMRKGLKLAAHARGHYSWRDAFRDWDENQAGRKIYKDSICVAIVLMAILAWTRTDNALYAIGFTTVSTVIATIAITWPLWRDPYREDFGSWVLFLLGGLAGAIAVKDALWPLDIINGFPPVLFVGVQLSMVILTGRRYIRRFAKAAP